jgi:DNA-binding transcriptional MerR regulator
MTMGIGVVADKLGMAASAIRYYEEIGLLGDVPRVGGCRRFDSALVQRLRLIRLLGDSGFSLEEARLLMSDSSPGRGDSRELGRRKLTEIEAQMQRLEVARAVVEWGLRCQCATFGECTCEIHEVIPTPSLGK